MSEMGGPRHLGSVRRTPGVSCRGRKIDHSAENRVRKSSKNFKRRRLKKFERLWPRLII